MYADFRRMSVQMVL